MRRSHVIFFLVTVTIGIGIGIFFQRSQTQWPQEPVDIVRVLYEPYLKQSTQVNSREILRIFLSKNYHDIAILNEQCSAAGDQLFGPTFDELIFAQDFQGFRYFKIHEDHHTENGTIVDVRFHLQGLAVKKPTVVRFHFIKEGDFRAWKINEIEIQDSDFAHPYFVRKETRKELNEALPTLIKTNQDCAFLAKYMEIL